MAFTDSSLGVEKPSPRLFGVAGRYSTPSVFPATVRGYMNGESPYTLAAGVASHSSPFTRDLVVRVYFDSVTRVSVGVLSVATTDSCPYPIGAHSIAIRGGERISMLSAAGGNAWVEPYAME